MMHLRFGSLRTRVLVLATTPLVAMIVTLLVLGHRAAEHTITANAREGLDNAGLVLEQTVRARRDALLAQARVTASDPRFFATFSVPVPERGAEFGPTLAGIAHDFLAITDADFLEIYDAAGLPIARARVPGRARPWSAKGHTRAGIERALTGELAADHFLLADVGTMVVDVPVFVAGHLEAVLRMGRDLDARFEEEIKRLTGAEIAIQTNGSPLHAPVHHVLTTTRALEGLHPAGGLRVVLARDVDRQLEPLRDAERQMALLGLLALVATIGASVAIAVGVTRPLRRIVDAAVRLRGGDYEAAVTMTGDDEVARLAQTFDAMREDLRAYVTHLRDVDRLKSDFLALAGHELKTPLTVIISFNDLLQSGAFGDLPEEVLETNGIIKEQLRRLDRMVQDILDLTTLEANGADALLRTRVDLAELVHVVGRTQEGARANRSLRLDLPAPDAGLEVNADQRMLARAVSALLDNAVRFTPDGGSIEVALVVDGDRVRLSVRDDGVGIAPDELRWITGKFYERGDLAHHRSGGLEFGARGLGLGLALVRAVVQAHGGLLHIESRPGRGSTFTIELPVTSAPRSVAPIPNPFVPAPAEVHA
jgi:signal transduction histidine kinase